jgi:CheY-like chemotaxis protein
VAPPATAPLVLIVDDFADAREMIHEYLEYSGFRAAEAVNGEEAIQKAHALGPDLILMDLSLPVIDGWEATRRLKKDPKTAHIPIIALTGHALSGYADGARAAGCDAFVAKPCLPEDVVREVRALLARTAGPDKKRPS